MAYDNIISRTDAAALIPEEVADGVITKAVEESVALTLFRRIPVSRKQVNIPIISALPVAHFVSGDTGMKQTTEVNWDKKTLNVEELAAIVPIPEAVLEDADYDVWGEIQPLLVEAVGRAVDAAIFFGTNKPASWPTAIVPAAVAAGNTFTEATTQANGGFQGDLDATLALLEADGFDATGIVASRSTRGKLRSARATTGERLEGLSPDLSEYLGIPITYPMRGLWATGETPPANHRLVVGDWTQYVTGIRKDITYKILDQAVITDPADGSIVYNLAQQDMVAMRVVFRVGVQVANVINHDNATANRYPAAVLRY